MKEIRKRVHIMIKGGVSYTYFLLLSFLLHYYIAVYN